MVAGATGVVISGVIFASTRRPPGQGHQTFDRETTDAAGRSTPVPRGGEALIARTSSFD